MTAEEIQKVFQAAEAIFEELKAPEDRTTFKLVTTRVSEETGLAANVVTPVVQMYVKGRQDLSVKRGRTGGIRKVFAGTDVDTTSADVPLGMVDDESLAESA